MHQGESSCVSTTQTQKPESHVAAHVRPNPPDIATVSKPVDEVGQQLSILLCNAYLHMPLVSYPKQRESNVGHTPAGSRVKHTRGLLTVSWVTLSSWKFVPL
mmetsp:Transcript_2771/g.4777  ORF Transcript_2771/g.4777 Transcript_2771/m.4777 type:complete len:102 (+) Transcript_2771:671-976(+)